MPFLIFRVQVATDLFASILTETRQKSPAILVTSLPPSVAKIRRVRKLENVEKSVKRESSSKNAKKSSD